MGVRPEYQSEGWCLANHQGTKAHRVTLGRAGNASASLHLITASEAHAVSPSGIFENSPAQVESARLLLDQWNVQNPDQRIGVNMQAVVRRVKEMRKSKDQRIADTAPKAMRASLRREVEGLREGR